MTKPTKDEAAKEPTPKKKNTQNTTNKKTKKNKKEGANKNWTKTILILLSVVFALMMTVIIGYGFHLDDEIKARFNGQIWQLPAVVYGRILHLTPGQAVTKNDLVRELEMLGYQKVVTPTNSGEYTEYSDEIELIRRPFHFEDGPEDALHAKVYFDQNTVTNIEHVETQKALGFLRIEPKILGMLDSGNDEQRIFLPRDRFPQFLVDALVNTEDRHFYKHNGISPVAIVRAFIVNFRAGKTIQGGSTLTQQLAKNMFLSRDRTLMRKLKEAYMAVLIDARYSKDQILEAYVNEIYLGQSSGQGVHGFPLGARLYFGRPIEELRTDQLAMLVAMIKGPSYYNPWRYPQRTKQRRDVVLKSMMEQGFIDSSQYVYFVSKPLDVKPKANLVSSQPAYFDELRREINERVGGNFNAKVGLRVFSTLDPLSQMEIEKTVVKKLGELQKRAGKEIEVAAVIADRMSGEIRAMVGGSRPGFAGFNRALNGRRQIGSLAKPAVYFTALEQHQTFNLASPIKDEPIKLQNTQGEIWEPQNYDKTFRGDVSLIQALAKSYNVPTVNLGMAVGVGNVVNTFKKMGVVQDVPQLPSIFLGALSLTPKEVTQIYQTLGSGGRLARLTALRAVVTQDGKVLYRNWPKSNAMLSEQASWLTMYGLKEAVRTGTAKFLQQDFANAELAGKTGTTDNNRDSWYVGMDGREVVTIWIGRDDNKPTPFTGSSGALRVYADYLKARGAERLILPWPSQIDSVPYRLQNNLILTDCTSANRIPVWDTVGYWKDYCKPKSATKIDTVSESTKSWFDKFFR